MKTIFFSIALVLISALPVYAQNSGGKLVKVAPVIRAALPNAPFTKADIATLEKECSGDVAPTLEDWANGRGDWSGKNTYCGSVRSDAGMVLEMIEKHCFSQSKFANESFRYGWIIPERISVKTCVKNGIQSVAKTLGVSAITLAAEESSFKAKCSKADPYTAAFDCEVSYSNYLMLEVRNATRLKCLNKLGTSESMLVVPANVESHFGKIESREAFRSLPFFEQALLLQEGCRDDTAFYKANPTLHLWADRDAPFGGM